MCINITENKEEYKNTIHSYRLAARKALYQQFNPPSPKVVQRLFQTLVDCVYQEEGHLLPFKNTTIVLHTEVKIGLGDASQIFLCAEKIKRYHPTSQIVILLESLQEERIRNIFPTHLYTVKIFSD